MSRLRDALHRTIGWAIWNNVWGCNPPDWVLNLHWKCTIKFGAPYLKVIADLVEEYRTDDMVEDLVMADMVEAYGPKKAPRSCSRSPEPDAADDGEGGPKTEGRQAHERRHRRKRKKSPSAAAPPKKKKRHQGQPHHDDHGVSKEHHRDCGEHHSGHWYRPFQDRDPNTGFSKGDHPTSTYTYKPWHLRQSPVRGHSPDSYSCYYSDSQKSESS